MATHKFPRHLAKYKALSKTKLWKLLDYDPITGIMRWKYRTTAMYPDDLWNSRENWNRRFAGKIAGHPTSKGYLRIGLGQWQYTIHVLAWIMMKGKPPLYQVDHENRKKADNRWINLRDIPGYANTQNVGKRKNNKTGYKGVMLHKMSSTARPIYHASITARRKTYHLGLFTCPKKAYRAYCCAAKKLHGKYAAL